MQKAISVADVDHLFHRRSSSNEFGSICVADVSTVDCLFEYQSVVVWLIIVCRMPIANLP
jgi:hypothetical protein